MVVLLGGPARDGAQILERRHIAGVVWLLAICRRWGDFVRRPLGFAPCCAAARAGGKRRVWEVGPKGRLINRPESHILINSVLGEQSSRRPW